MANKMSPVWATPLYARIRMPPFQGSFHWPTVTQGFTLGYELKVSPSGLGGHLTPARCNVVAPQLSVVPVLSMWFTYSAGPSPSFLLESRSFCLFLSKALILSAVGKSSGMVPPSSLIVWRTFAPTS